LTWITSPDASQVWTAEERWRFASAFGHPSDIGVVTATAVFMMRARARTSRRRWFLGTLTIFTLLATISRTAIAGFAAGLIFVAAKKKHLILTLCLTGSLLAAAILITPSHELLWQYISRSQSSEDIFSLTGRVPVYQDAISRLQVHWAFGQGFLSSRVLLLNEQSDNNGTVHPHNMLLAAATGMGMGGLILAVGSIVSLFAAVVRLLRVAHYYPGIRGEALSCAAAALPLIAFCILDSGFVARLSPFVFLYLAAAARTQDLLNICKLRTSTLCAKRLAVAD